jgi:hypothetical protein
MVEVQCWEGDGVIPPEIQALIKRVTELERENAELKAEITGLEELAAVQKKTIHAAHRKLYAIERVMAEKDDEITKMDPVYEPMNHPTEIPNRPEPTNDVKRDSADHRFDKIFDLLTNRDHA